MSKQDYNLLIKDPEDIKRYWEARNHKPEPRERTTTNLAEFGYIERLELIRLLAAWNEQGLPEDFGSEGVEPMFNKDSGYVFLTNSEYQVAMMNGDKLELWYYCGNCGHEGFAGDCDLCEDGCNQCM